jgi:hypothetical protein
MTVFGTATLAGAALTGVTLTGTLAAPSHASASGVGPVQHVLIMSVDGLHQSDAIWFVDNHPRFAPLLAAGVVYADAQTAVPADSLAGAVSQLTGGSPGTTGVYGAIGYDHSLLPAGTKSTSATRPGAVVDLTGDLDENESAIDAGQGLSGLPDGILNMTGTPQDLINPAKLPVDPSTGQPVTPSEYLKVNTVFNVAHDAGLLTAWVGDHPSYSILNGPSGNGIDDLFTPEISSKAPSPFGSGGWTKFNAATRLFDNYKAQAVLNEIDGFNHSGTTQVGTPAIFGVDFDSVQAAEEQAASYGEAGGYETVNGQTIPGPLMQGALTFLDSWLGRFVAELAYTGQTDDTAIILTGTNGTSPTDPQAIIRVNDQPVISGLDRAWAASHPGSKPLVVSSSDNDALELWLSDRSEQAADFAQQYLASHSAAGTTASGARTSVPASGTGQIYAGAAAAAYFGVPAADSRHPDVFATTQTGVVYNAGRDQVAGTGGGDSEDLNVPLILLDPAATPGSVRTPVSTTQIAPTILSILGLDPGKLAAVQADHTQVLPGS